MDFPLFQILSFPDELEKSLNPQSQKYVRDTKAMVSTAVDVKELPDAYVFVADMPGLKSADVKVDFFASEFFRKIMTTEILFLS